MLDWLFPNDKDTNKQRAVEVGLYFYAFCDTTWCHNEKVELKAINLSQIMYTYNPEQFKPISMLCTEEQWNDDLKPVVEAFGLCTKEVNKWDECRIIKNNFNKQPNYIGTINWHKLTQDHYSQTEFLEACGIVRADKVEDIKIEKTNFKMEMQKDGNKVSFSLVVDQTKPIIEWNATKTLCHTITTDQIKTARTNPETLEELFPKVFEKPVVEVGKWWHIKSKGSNFEYKFYITKNENGQLYGYGFDDESVWCNENRLIREHVIGSATLCNLSDLQPLFEAEFNKRYKEGDLLRNEYGAEGCYSAKFDWYDFSLGKITDMITRLWLFKNGNFAKVIKSAELIKAEQELEQAKKKVERLTNK